MTENEKVKLQQSLVFETSELWDSIILILDAAIESEVGIAISQHTTNQIVHILAVGLMALSS